jgi:hypothetical protein
MTWVILALIAAVVILTFTRPWTLFAVGDSQRLAQNNDFCRQIAGEWVDQVEGSGSRELGSVEYIHDSNAGTIIIKGQSYSRDGGFDAKWHSITSHVNAQDRTLSYIWEGSHNARGETFKGFGKISFLQSLKEARGEFWDIDAATLTLVSKSSRLYKSKGALRSYDAAGVEEAWELQVARRKPDSINSSRA